MTKGYAMDVVLATQSADPFLALRNVRRFADGSGFGAILVVRSRGFACDRAFHVEPGPLATFLEEVERMDRTLTGSATLQPLYDGQFLELQLDQAGRVTVRGELHEYSASPQHLRFEFETDQTCLATLAADLRACLQLAVT